MPIKNMRIRKEIAPLQFKIFIRSVLLLLLALNGFIVLLNFLSGKALLEYSLSNWVLGGLQPILLASVFTYTGRKVLLFVNDYQNIESFKDKLNQQILNKGVRADVTTDTQSRFVATGWFYKLFNYWNGVETVTVQWGNEIIVSGSSRIVSQVEDSLTWNPDFRN
ncbi:MAG: hypothetical protein KF763_08890 [Cyclobacteriaceae bacterium]|nr:hypothetical protein [Cyclobacteriaceae bacterium]